MTTSTLDFGVCVGRATLRAQFAGWSDRDLVYWLGQYSGRQAGHYPGIRRRRVAAESVARERGIQWQLAQPPNILDVDLALAAQSADDRTESGHQAGLAFRTKWSTIIPRRREAAR
jgi:hypothetical protein